jgi:hypothetical protein
VRGFGASLRHYHDFRAAAFFTASVVLIATTVTIAIFF